MRIEGTSGGQAPTSKDTRAMPNSLVDGRALDD
jgi:hypothetical protein